LTYTIAELLEQYKVRKLDLKHQLTSRGVDPQLLQNKTIHELEEIVKNLKEKRTAREAR
jgi:hypothetical protein